MRLCHANASSGAHPLTLSSAPYQSHLLSCVRNWELSHHSSLVSLIKSWCNQMRNQRLSMQLMESFSHQSTWLSWTVSVSLSTKSTRDALLFQEVLWNTLLLTKCAKMKHLEVFLAKMPWTCATGNTWEQFAPMRKKNLLPATRPSTTIVSWMSLRATCQTSAGACCLMSPRPLLSLDLNCGQVSSHTTAATPTFTAVSTLAMVSETTTWPSCCDCTDENIGSP